MIDRDHTLPVARQAKLLNLARSTVYYKPRPVSAEDLALMRRLDELHLDYPFAGARMLCSLLRREGVSNPYSISASSPRTRPLMLATRRTASRVPAT